MTQNPLPLGATGKFEAESTHGGFGSVGPEIGTRNALYSIPCFSKSPGRKRERGGREKREEERKGRKRERGGREKGQAQSNAR